MKAIISVVNYNTKDLTLNCLETIYNKNWVNSLEVWVVDNASSDDSGTYIKKKFPEVHLIENKKNLGFGKAHNQVFKKAFGDYFFVVNSDCEIEEKVFDEMIQFMSKHSECGLSSCKILGFDGNLQPNGGDLPLGRALFSWLFNLEFLGRMSSFHRNEPEYYEKAHEVGWVSGNFMVIKKEVLKKIKGFNEDYFMYFEDVEFCFRAKKAGFKVMIYPSVSLKHLSGGSLDDPKFRQWSGEYKGLVIFYKQHFGSLPALFIRILVYLSTILRIIAFFLTGNFRFSYIYGKVIANF